MILDIYDIQAHVWKSDTYKLVLEGSNLPPNRNVLSGVHV